MSRENTDLCNNPFVALFGSITQVELYKTSVDDAAKSGMYIIKYNILMCLYLICVIFASYVLVL